METIVKRCVKSTNCPKGKDLSSTVQLHTSTPVTYIYPSKTTHLSSIKATIITQRSHREHPPDYCISNMNNTTNNTNTNHKDIRSYNKKCSVETATACPSLSSSDNNYKNNKQQQQQNILHQRHKQNATGPVDVSNMYKLIKFLTSSTLATLAFKVSHRKNKCNSSNNSNNNNNAVISTANATWLRKLMLLQRASATTATSTTRTILRTKSVRCKTATTTRIKCRLLPSLGTTSFFTLLTLVCLEMILLSTVSNCAKTFYMHWNTSNSIFRIDNTDHIIDVNKGNLAFEFDQVHIICPVYEPGTFENETEKYIIYNVSKVEYETCRITNADPRVIAICDKPQKLMFFTITFRPFTPQPGGLEFLPGNDYYFISTSSKDDLYRRIGGRCSTNNMKVVFKVCCAPEDKNKTNTSIVSSRGSSIGNNGVIESGGGGKAAVNIDINTLTNVNQQHNSHNINTIGIKAVNTGLMPGNGININSANNGVQLTPLNGPSGTSINTNIDQFNRNSMQTNGINVIGSHGGSSIMLTPGQGGINMIPTSGIGQYPGHHSEQTGIRINNVPTQQHFPSHKSSNNNNDDHYDKHPNEVVKNEELTYNSASSSIHRCCSWSLRNIPAMTSKLDSIISATFTATGRKVISYISQIVNKFRYDKFLNMNQIVNIKNIFTYSNNPVILISILLSSLMHFTFKYSLSSSMLSMLYTRRSDFEIKSANSSYLLVNKNSKMSIIVCTNNDNFR